MRRIRTPYGLDFEDLCNLVRNEVSWKKCQSCDNNGRVWYDDSICESVQSSPSGIPKENLASDSCKDCDGLGYFFYYKD